LSGKNELYKFIQDGIDDIENGRIVTESEILNNMNAALKS
jgi:predicted transcriptional regulator